MATRKIGKGMAFALYLVNEGILRLLITPLERFVIPRLEKRTQSRFYKSLLKLALWLVVMGHIKKTDIRLTVKHWTGPNWSVVYIGRGTSPEAIKHYLFQSPPSEKELPRAFLWQVPGLIRKFTTKGELVVCEINRAVQFPKRKVDVFFITPLWIIQVLEGIHKPISDILEGMNQNTRRNIRRLEAQGFSYEFTSKLEDFDLFYNRMYLPYIKLRHAERSVLHDYDTLYKRFNLGGLILIKQDQSPVCGMMCQIKGDLCEAGSMGVQDGQFDLVKQGSNFALWWFMLDWARQQGAARFDFGPSRPVASDGVFNFKRQWGTRVYSDFTREQWSFYGLNLPFELRQHLNQAGFISMMDNKGYRVVLSNPGSPSGGEDFTTLLKEANSCGLAGIYLINDVGKPRMIPATQAV